MDKEGHNEGAGGSAPLVPGAVVEVIVVKAKDKRLIRVTTNRETVSGALTTEWKGLTIGESGLAFNSEGFSQAMSLMLDTATMIKLFNCKFALTIWKGGLAGEMPVY